MTLAELSFGFGEGLVGAAATGVISLGTVEVVEEKKREGLDPMGLPKSQAENFLS